MNRRLVTITAWICVMAAFGVGVNRWLLDHKHDPSDIHRAVQPTASHSLFALSGTVYISDEGRIYALQGTTFTDIGLPHVAGRWMQPAALADGTLLVVLRNPESSDLYHVTSDGRILAELTTNDMHSTQAAKIRSNHWVFWPRVAADGTVFLSYDSPKAPDPNGYEVDFSVWAGHLGGTLYGKRWTTPDYYTGGDTMPVPLSAGGIIYVTYSIGPNGKAEASVVYQKAPMSAPQPLTAESDDCFAIALAPDEQSLAMACSGGSQKVDLKVAHLDIAHHTLDPATTLVSGCLCNSPSWGPTSEDLLYLAPAPSDPNGSFQLWELPGAAPAVGAAPRARQVSDQLDVDATSAPLWVS